MNLDNILVVVNQVYKLDIYKKEFLKELTINDIDNESLECKYQKWLIRKFSEDKK